MCSPVKFRVAICGGGIGGLTAAVALCAHADISVQVYEAAAEFAEVGAGIGIFPRAWEVIRRLGLEKELLKRSAGDTCTAEGPGIRYRKSDQNPGLEFYTLITERNMVPLHRIDFQTALLKSLPATCQTHCSKRLRSYTQRVSGGPIELLFQDGSTTTCDVLVGADGLKSAVRRTFLDEKARRVWSGSDTQGTGSSEEADRLRSLVDPVWSGYCAYRAIIPVERLKSRAPDHPILSMPTQYLGKDGYVIAYPIARGRFLNFVAFTSQHDLENTSYDGPWALTTNRHEFAGKFKHWEPEVQQLIESVENPIRWAVHVVKPLDTFVSERVVLIGDAAHAMTPHQGSGAGQAIEDAYILATVLSHPATTLQTLEYALHVFDQVRRPHCLEVAKRSRRNGQFFTFHDQEFSNMPEQEVLAKLKESSKEFIKAWEWAWLTSIESSVKEVEMLLAECPKYDQ